MPEDLAAENVNTAVGAGSTTLRLGLGLAAMNWPLLLLGVGLNATGNYGTSIIVVAVAVALMFLAFRGTNKVTSGASRALFVAGVFSLASPFVCTGIVDTLHILEHRYLPADKRTQPQWQYAGVAVRQSLSAIPSTVIEKVVCAVPVQRPDQIRTGKTDVWLIDIRERRWRHSLDTKLLCDQHGDIGSIYATKIPKRLSSPLISEAINDSIHHFDIKTASKPKLLWAHTTPMGSPTLWVLILIVMQILMNIVFLLHVFRVKAAS